MIYVNIVLGLRSRDGGNSVSDYARYRELFRGRSMPLAFVDLDLFDENVRQIRARLGAHPLRIASKSIRCRALIERVLDADPSCQGVLCYSGWEAVFLSRHGIDYGFRHRPAAGFALEITRRPLEGVERICAIYGGRPHWGKMHT